MGIEKQIYLGANRTSKVENDTFELKNKIN